MSDDELEEDLARLEPARPRPELRSAVLGRLRGELADGECSVGTPRRARFAHRLVWVAAASLLVVLQVTLAHVNTRHEKTMRGLIGEEAEALDHPRDRAARDIEEAVVALVDDPETRSYLRRLVRERITRRSVVPYLTTARMLDEWLDVSGKGDRCDG